MEEAKAQEEAKKVAPKPVKDPEEDDVKLALKIQQQVSCRAYGFNFPSGRRGI